MKMKKYLSIAILLLMMASPVVFTSCGNDDPMEEVESPETKLDVWTEPYHIMGPLDGSPDSAVAETFLPGNNAYRSHSFLRSGR